MIEKIEKIYLSKTLFIVSSAVTVCCYLADAIKAIMNGYIADYAWIFLALIALLQWAFFSGHINVQKMLFGALLLYMIKEQCELMVINTEYAGGQVNVFDIIVLVFSALIFIFHLIQQMDHKGKILSIIINQLIGFVAVIFLISIVLNLVYAPETFATYIFVIGYIFNCIMVICMETRVNQYKQIRDKARSEGTWTEEIRTEAKKLFKLS